MFSIRTVLCPVDFSPATSRQVDVAADLCRAFEAHLVLHHNMTQLSAGAAVGWMYAADHPASDTAIEQQMRDVVKRAGAGVKVDAHITHGVPLPTVLALAEAIEADLLVLSTHGGIDDDRPSVTERVLADSDRAVLALHEASEDYATPTFASAEGAGQVVVVPTDFTKGSMPAVQFAFELARKLPVEVHLLHLEPARGSRVGPEREIEMMAGLVPDDLADRTRLHVEQGDPASGIAMAAARLGAACIVMGEHTRAPLRRWFSRDTSKAVLHKAHCPVWFVPGSGATVQTHEATQPESPAST